MSLADGIAWEREFGNSMSTKVETSNGRNCRNCNKSNVCKYKETVVEEVEKLIVEVANLELPLSININCREFLGKNSTVRGVQ
ncbi:hypothetical protein [Konateibacter massiliensis]|uniref:hypothetical protein n=1 Tax=Konateibacter massiliensis TaxID=2002841 RepID=UPI000C154DEF|nr:hypothetical protein [Konateibacter massiliensis]